LFALKEAAMIIICQKCGSRYKIDDSLVAGGPKRTKCKKCGEPILIKPQESEVSPAAGPATSSTAPVSALKDQTPGMDSQISTTQEATPSPRPGIEAGKEPETKAAAGLEKPSADRNIQAEGTAQAELNDQESAQEKLEKRRRQMEDEISGRLNKAALETLDLDTLHFLAAKVRTIEDNPDYKSEESTQLFACIGCKSIFALFPEDPRQCTSCSGDMALVRCEDILRQFGMFNR
jgi:predicted Zn finger-like uncharacterized protein